MGNKVSNFFKQDWDSIKDFVSGSAGVLTDTLKGVTGGGWDYSNVKRDFSNYGADVKDAFTGQTGGKQSAPKAPMSQAQMLQQFYNPTSASNASLWQGSAAASYSGQSPLAGTVPPSHLSAISDPSQKMLVATTRGTMRSTLNTFNTASNALSSQQLGMAVAPASQVTNSAGGTGIATSADVKSQMS